MLYKPPGASTQQRLLSDTECQQNLLCTEAEALNLLQSLDVAKTDGPDGVLHISSNVLLTLLHLPLPNC